MCFRARKTDKPHSLIPVKSVFDGGVSNIKPDLGGDGRFLDESRLKKNDRYYQKSYKRNGGSICAFARFCTKLRDILLALPDACADVTVFAAAVMTGFNGNICDRKQNSNKHHDDHGACQ